uniref:Uncharacterized protein n=1 Tax=Ascaris lumbricoides TaxID=6252 RepID=A0A9J2PLY3_ASCLU
MGELETKGQEDDKLSSEFAASGRTGRRNAVPDVDVQGIDPDAIKLAERISHINTTDEEIHQSTSSTSDNATRSQSELHIDLYPILCNVMRIQLKSDNHTIHFLDRCYVAAGSLTSPRYSQLNIDYFGMLTNR